MQRLMPIVLAAVVASGLGYLINQLPAIPDFPHKDRWIIAAVVVLTLLAVAVTLWQMYQDNQTSGDAGSRFSPEQLRKTRGQLLNRLQSDVQLRLESSLHRLTKLDLQMEDQRQQVGKPQAVLVSEDPPVEPQGDILNRLFQSFEQGARPALLPANQRIVEVFKRRDVQGKLLILGEPGAGKTTELLTLAQDLLQRAVNEDNDPIPVIFELSTWKENKPIGEWLVEQLKAVYRIPLDLGQQWIEEQQVLPLLDGLDELGLVRQQQCIEAINQFLAEQLLPQCVVCCRREEYEQGQVKLEQMNGAVYLRALTDEQIEQYFRRLNRLQVWAAVQQNRELLELARTPLFLHMLVYAYQGNQDRAIQNSQELFETYVERRLDDPRSQGIYPPGKAPSSERTCNYLVWLAWQLEATQQTEFLIEGMQPSWLNSAKQKQLYRVIFRLMFGLIDGLIFVLTGGLNLGLFFVLMFGLIGGLSAGLFFVLMFVPAGGLSGETTITPTEQLSWSWQAENNRLILGLILGLFAELGAGLFFGRSIVLTVGMSSEVIVGVSNMLIVGLIFWLTGGLIVVLIVGLSEFKIENKTIPNQGVWRSVINAEVTGLTVGLTVGLIVGLIVELSGGLSGGLIVGLIVGLIGGLSGGLIRGGAAAIQHFALRLVLYRNGNIPWNYARFLDHAVKHRFIQRVGGRYRFMHDLLRKHFAEMPLP